MATRPRTYFVDFADLESKMTAPDAGKPSPRKTGRRMLTSVDAEAKKVRSNSQDAAKAVLAWVSGIVEHEGDTDLNAVLAKCLRPGPNTQRVSYAAIAEEIGRTMNVQLSPKRIKTAIGQLRKVRESKMQQMPPQNIRQKLIDLHDRLEADFAALTGNASEEQTIMRREIALQVLTAVRKAASRLIENDFGEGIPDAIDIDELEGRFLDFVRDIVNDKPGDSLHQQLRRLLITLGEYDGATEYDMRLVVEGSRVVNALQSPDSLPGVMAQLNVLVAGRHLLDSELYVAEMTRLAELAHSLQDAAGTKTLLNWIRRLPEDQRIPSPNRVASYCLNNASTHLLERVFRGESADPETALVKAAQYIDSMKLHDGGFDLLKTTEVIRLAVLAHQTGDSAPVRDHFKALGEEKSIALIQDLIRYENSAKIVAAARDHAIAALPALRNQIINIR